MVREDPELSFLSLCPLPRACKGLPSAVQSLEFEGSAPRLTLPPGLVLQTLRSRMAKERKEWDWIWGTSQSWEEDRLSV